MTDPWTRHPQPAWLRHGPTDQPLNWPGGILHHRAIHEAGHAVAHLAAGRPIQRIWISDGHPAGHAGQVEPASKLWTHDFEALAGMYAAGERAANLWLHTIGRWSTDTAWAAERGADSDRVDLQGAVDQVGIRRGSPQDLWEWACRAADRLLTTHWPAVGELAAALLAAPGMCLDQAQIEALATRI